MVQYREMDSSGPFNAESAARRGDTATVSVVMSADHLGDLRRDLAERTAQSSTDDIVTTARLAKMRRRLNELEHTSENSTDGAEVMAAEEEAREIVDSFENVRDLEWQRDSYAVKWITDSPWRTSGLEPTSDKFFWRYSRAARTDSSAPARSSYTLTLNPPLSVRTKSYAMKPLITRIKLSTSSDRCLSSSISLLDCL
jgi:hypothetical protein